MWTTARERRSGKKPTSANSRLQELINSIATLVTRSRDVLRRQRPEDSAPAGDGPIERVEVSSGPIVS